LPARVKHGRAADRPVRHRPGVGAAGPPGGRRDRRTGL